MHHELTKEDKARIDALKTITSKTEVVAIDKTNSLLPIAENETRTPVIDNKIYYGEGKASLDVDAIKYLTDLAKKLLSNSSLKLEIAIHCDLNNEASIADYICKLRIKRIADLMVNQLSINFQQLVIRSVGMNEPLNTCKKGDAACTSLDHQMNRRTEIKFLN
jgi:outer membrane protein OmpA-like peptidoglycan-associated protein